ncbi:MAG: hypothetical protein KBS59_07750 [Clostridiales bacterium]|nr:hypothetical protein [Clostridiales bacterium]
MKENKHSFSLCGFLGKIVIKAAAIVAIFVGVNVVLTKFFNKSLKISIDVENNELPDDEEAAETEAVDGEDGDADETDGGEEIPEE